MGQLVSAVNQAEPDLILIAGDMITREARYIEPAAVQAGRLRARHGVLAAFGDHENFAYVDQERSRREVQDAMARHGVPMIDNQVVKLEIGGATLAVIVATHNYINRIGRDTARQLLDQARGADFTILVAHQGSGELLAEAERGGVDLFLAGHTHGGQIRFWLPFADLTPARLETPYLEGAFQLGDMTLVVTSGLGMSVVPFRYRSPASVDLIRLRRGAPLPSRDAAAAGKTD
jgi:hypothetical protein